VKTRSVYRGFERLLRSDYAGCCSVISYDLALDDENVKARSDHGKKESKRPTARVILDVPEPIRIIKSDGKRVKLSTNFNQERNQID